MQVGYPLRINLKFPPDQYMYVKASTASERQQWLVALGSSKACLTQGNTPEKTKKNHHHGNRLCNNSLVMLVQGVSKKLQAFEI